jgi:hypothetical protein
MEPKEMVPMAGTMDRGTAPAPAPPAPVQHDGLAIASLICAFFIPLLGIVFGHVSRHLAKKEHRPKSGIALAGLIIGYIFMAVGIIVAIAVGAAVSTSTTAVSAQSTAPAQTSAPPTTAAPTTEAPSPSPSVLTGPVGTTYTVTNSDGTSYDVTLQKVIDPATGANEFYTPGSGKRFVAAVFRITGNSGTSKDDVNLLATVNGSDEQVYEPAFDEVAGYTNFNAGDFNVSPGASQTGAVVFTVPSGAKVASVQWSAGFGSDNSATWTVSG